MRMKDLRADNSGKGLDNTLSLISIYDQMSV